MFYNPLLSVDASNFHFGEPLAMALAFHRVFTATEFDDGNFIATAVAEDFSLNAGATHNGRADANVVALTDQQHLVKGHCGAGFSFNFFKAKHFTFKDAVLFAARYDNCVHNCMLQKSGRREAQVDLFQPDATIGAGRRACAVILSDPAA
jgi:hypothetical protein